MDTMQFTRRIVTRSAQMFALLAGLLISALVPQTADAAARYVALSARQSPE